MGSTSGFSGQPRADRLVFRKTRRRPKGACLMRVRVYFERRARRPAGALLRRAVDPARLFYQKSIYLSIDLLRGALGAGWFYLFILEVWRGRRFRDDPPPPRLMAADPPGFVTASELQAARTQPTARVSSTQPTGFVAARQSEEVALSTQPRSSSAVQPAGDVSTSARTHTRTSEPQAEPPPVCMGTCGWSDPMKGFYPTHMRLSLIHI